MDPGHKIGLFTAYLHDADLTQTRRMVEKTGLCERECLSELRKGAFLFMGSVAYGQLGSIIHLVMTDEVWNPCMVDIGWHVPGIKKIRVS